GRTLLAPFVLTCPGNHLFELDELIFLELVRHAEESASSARRRAVEEYADDLTQRRLLCHRVGDDWAVEEATVRLGALDVALVLKPLEHCAHGRSAQLNGEGVADVGNGQGP